MIELSITILELDRIAAAVERLSLIQSAARFTYKLTLSVANLTDPALNLVATGAALVTVTVGDPAAITAINLNLPE